MTAMLHTKMNLVYHEIVTRIRIEKCIHIIQKDHIQQYMPLYVEETRVTIKDLVSVKHDVKKSGKEKGVMNVVNFMKNKVCHESVFGEQL